MSQTSRDKLNGLHLSCAIGVAALVAAMAGSWPLFILVAAAIILAGLASGEVRGPQHRGGRPSRRR